MLEDHLNQCFPSRPDGARDLGRSLLRMRALRLCVESTPQRLPASQRQLLRSRLREVPSHDPSPHRDLADRHHGCGAIRCHLPTNPGTAVLKLIQVVFLLVFLFFLL